MINRPGRTPDAGLVTLSLGLLTVALGFIGYRQADPALDASGALYQALQLLVLDYHGPPSDPPLALQAARYLGAFVLAYALFSVAVAIGRERVDALRLRLFARKHHVVIGLGSQGSAVVSGLRAGRHLTAVVESDRTAASVSGARAEGALLLLGDARNPTILDRARAVNSAHVLVVAGDDSTNLEIMAAIEERIEATAVPGPRVHVGIDDRYLWAQLHRLSLERDHRSGRVEFVSFPDRIALQLVESAHDDLAAGEAEGVLVWGAGPSASRTAIHVVRRRLLAGRKPELHLGGPESAELRSKLLAEDPWMEEYLVSARADPREVPFDLAFVVGLREASALAAGARLGETQPQARVVISVPADASEQPLARAGYDVARIRLVAAHRAALDPRLFEETAFDVIARAKHEDYVGKEIARGVSRSDNPSIAPWEELPSSLQASNRFFAQSVGAKLSGLHAQLRPLAGAHPESRFPLSPDDLEELAADEHERWVNDLLADGWQPTEGDKDPERKLHPLLVPWQALAEDTREKDRDGVRALPSMLARVGYEIDMPPD